MGIEVICSPDLVVIGKANGSTSSRLAILKERQMMGSSLIDSYTSSEIEEKQKKSKTEFHLNRG